MSHAWTFCFSVLQCLLTPMVLFAIITWFGKMVVHTHTSNHTFLLVSCKHQTCFTRVGSEAESRRSLRSFTRVFFLDSSFIRNVRLVRILVARIFGCLFGFSLRLHSCLFFKNQKYPSCLFVCRMSRVWDLTRLGGKCFDHLIVGFSLKTAVREPLLELHLLYQSYRNLSKVTDPWSKWKWILRVTECSWLMPPCNCK